MTSSIWFFMTLCAALVVIIWQWWEYEKLFRDYKKDRKILDWYKETVSCMLNTCDIVPKQQVDLPKTECQVLPFPVEGDTIH